MESFVDFRVRDLEVVNAHADGSLAAYPAVENRHVNHILDTTMAPARDAPEIAAEAEAIARHIAERLELVGMLAVEMFVTHREAILVNELAPRPHNSGHWTIDACVTSQFEQLVRAICGLPLGSTERHSDAVMTNLIGRDVGKWRDALDDRAPSSTFTARTKCARPEDGPHHPAFSARFLPISRLRELIAAPVRQRAEDPQG